MIKTQLVESKIDKGHHIKRVGIKTEKIKNNTLVNMKLTLIINFMTKEGE